METHFTVSLGADILALYTLSNLPKKVQQIILDHDFFFSPKYIIYENLVKYKQVLHKVCVGSLHYVGSVMPCMHEYDCFSVCSDILLP